MKEMTTQERYNDICRRSGLSEQIVRSVIKAETESAVESIKKGYSITFPGRCVAYPSISLNNVVKNGRLVTEKSIRVKMKPTNSFLANFDGITEFEEVNEEEDDGVQLNQIPALL